jgi:hypothetical protein
VGYFQIGAATTEETTKAVPSYRTPKLAQIQQAFPYMQLQFALVFRFTPFVIAGTSGAAQ